MKKTPPIDPVPHEIVLSASIAALGLAEAFVGLANLMPGADIVIAPELLPVGLGRPAVMALRLLLGCAAIGFALTKRFRLGLATLALWSLARWVAYIVSLNRNVMDVFFSANSAADALALFQIFGQPVLIAGVFIAACRTRYLATGVIAAGSMTFVDLSLFEVIIFIIGVALYGA